MRRLSSRSAKGRLSSDEGEELRFGREADVLLRSLAVAENHDGGDAAHAKLPSGERGFVDVQFTDDSFLTQLVCHLIDDRSQLLTWTTPRRCKVNQYGLVALEDCLFEIQIIEDLDVFGCHDFCNITPAGASASRLLFLTEKYPDFPTHEESERRIHAPRGRRRI